MAPDTQTRKRVLLVVDMTDQIDRNSPTWVPQRAYLTYEAADGTTAMAPLGEDVRILLNEVEEYGIRLGRHPDDHTVIQGYADPIQQAAAVLRMRGEGQAAVPVTRTVGPWLEDADPAPAGPAADPGAPYDSLTARNRARFAQYLARRFNADPDSAELGACVAYWLSIIRPDCTSRKREDLWAEYCTALEVQDGVQIGSVTWDQVEPQLTSPCRDEDALDIAMQRTADALSDLIGTGS